LVAPMPLVCVTMPVVGPLAAAAVITCGEYVRAGEEAEQS
jgi:hypothetical protein